jgi:hypothetical protein
MQSGRLRYGIYLKKILLEKTCSLDGCGMKVKEPD